MHSTLSGVSGAYAGKRCIPTSRLFCWRILTSVAIHEQGIRGLYAVNGSIALSPSKKVKYVSYNTKTNTITTQQMVFFSNSKCTENHFRLGLCPGLNWGSLRRSPRPPSRLGSGHPLAISFPSPGKLQQQHAAKPCSRCVCVELVINHNAE